MDQGSKLLSAITTFLKYSKYLPDLKRRETLTETIDRSRQMDLERFPQLQEQILAAYTDVDNLLVMPSMRKLQFAGDAILRNHARSYNCSFAHLKRPRAFSEGLFLLLSGVGFGYSVQRRHVDQLPKIKQPTDSYEFQIPDSIEGWAMALEALMCAYMEGRPEPTFDYSAIRPKGSYLVTTGAKAPGPRPLSIMLSKVRSMLKAAVGRKLKPIEAHDIMCVVSDCVVSGGVRRSAMISLFDRDDQEMLGCKSGEWWKTAPYRMRSNNSAVLHRVHTTYEEFMRVYIACRDSKAGEPGIFWTNDYELGTNPCAEISLKDRQFCNLSTINMTKVASMSDLYQASRSASILGTLQATYTDFTYLDEGWRQVTEEDALLGVSMTGVADNWKAFGYQPSKLMQATAIIRDTNIELAEKIGINPAARLTTLKPEGTASCVLRSSSGVHGRHASKYVRNMRILKSEPLYQYLLTVVPELVADDQMDKAGAILSIPVRSPDGAITRDDETALQMFDRVLHMNQFWVRMGHISGKNPHNVSATVSVKDHEWDELGQRLWLKRDLYAGISLLPHDGGSYVQAPFECVDDEKFSELESKLSEVDLTQVTEESDNTARGEQSACAGGGCAID